MIQSADEREIVFSLRQRSRAIETNPQRSVVRLAEVCVDNVSLAIFELIVAIVIAHCLHARTAIGQSNRRLQNLSGDHVDLGAELAAKNAFDREVRNPITKVPEIFLIKLFLIGC